jgi:hypothetical protein
MRPRLLLIGALTALLALPALGALANDRVVFGGSAEVREDEVVDGDLVVFGGSARIAGRVTGDAVVFGGKVVLEESGAVEGDLVSMGGSIDRRGTVGGSATSLGAEPGEIDEIVAEALEEAEEARTEALEDAVEQAMSARVHGDSEPGPRKGGFGSKVKAFFLYCHIAYMALIAILILLEFNPERILTVTRTVEIRPGRSLLAGALTMTAFGLVFLLFAISVVGIPIAVLVPFVLALVGFPGVMGMCGVIARKLPLGRVSGSTGAWLIGAVLMALLPLISYKFLGLFLFTVLFTIGLGAGILSRFGRRDPVI